VLIEGFFATRTQSDVFLDFKGSIFILTASNSPEAILRLFVDHIKDSGLVLDGEEPVEALNRHFGSDDGGALTFLAPLHYRVRALKSGDIVDIEGELATRLQLSCSRCLADFPLVLEFDFAVAFTHADALSVEDDSEDGVELTADELGLGIYEGEEIDLHEALYEQILLALPSRPLCSDACKGLCSVCGTDLNVSTCRCSPEPFNSKFGALKDFKPGE